MNLIKQIVISKKWLVYSYGIAILFVLAIVTFSTRGERSIAHSPFQKINVGITPTEYSTLVTVAEDQNLFRKNHLDATIKVYESGRVGLDHLLRGDVDIVTAADTAFTKMSFEETKLRIIANITRAEINEIVARKDAGIEKPGDLKGKRIGVTRGTSGEFFLMTYLLFHHLTPQEVTIVHVPAPKLAETLASGALDAICSWDIYVFDAEKRLGKNAVRWPAQGGQDFFWLLISTKKFIEEQPALIESLLRGLLEAEVFVKRHPDLAQSLSIRLWQRTPEFLQYFWPKIKFYISLDQSLITALESNADFQGKKEHPVKLTPNYLDYIYTKGLITVDPKRVTIFR